MNEREKIMTRVNDDGEQYGYANGLNIEEDEEMIMCVDYRGIIKLLLR